jgi:hypothetical protein
MIETEAHFPCAPRIEQDPSIPVPNPPAVPVRGSPLSDRRRVMALNQVTANGAVART